MGILYNDFLDFEIGLVYLVDTRETLASNSGQSERNNMNELLEWSAFSVGTIGTLFWAAGWKWRGRSVEGWFWLASALLWIWFAIINHHAGLAARDLLGVALYIVGIVKSFQAAPAPAI